ncbi:MAG: DUF1566 domain-containing protein [Desulfuromonadales bacterium]
MKHLFISLFFFTLLTSLFTIAFAAPPAPVPQTGQTTCYDALNKTIACSGTGQDGELKMGVVWPNPRFVDNGNQTVTDKLTGLIWTKDANLMKTRDPSFDTDYSTSNYREDPNDGMVTWQRALDYVKKLNTENYLGFNDWRLPNINELASLDNKMGSLYSWLNTQGFSNVQAYYYWSSSTYVGYTGYACYVYMLYGSVSSYYKTDHFYVWPVRGGQWSSGYLALPKTGQTTCYDASGATIACSGTGQDGELQNGVAWPNPRFTPNADLTVTDNLTGLIWSKNANPAASYRTFQEALDYIKTLNSSFYLAHNDWRLPNIKELASLFNNYGQSNQTVWLNTQPFSNNVQAASYWSSSTRPNYDYYYNAWYVNPGVDYFDKSRYYYVWPVHGGHSPSASLTLSTSKTGSGSGTITSNPVGISCGATCSASFTNGTSVTLTATPDTGSAFAGWSGACSGTGTCTVTMDTAWSVRAVFKLPTTPSITWYHQGDGKVSGITTNGSSITGGAQFWQEPKQAWSIVGQGDFDGDGIRDFVWWNSTTGQVYIMLMSSPTAVKSGATVFTEPNTNWRIVATGDINGDGTTDLIWWNRLTGQVYAIMLQNGKTILGTGMIYTEPNTAWKIVATADFNGNGKAELLWWNSSTGQVAIGQTNGTNASTANVIYTEPNTDWRIAGAGDLDGDGKAEIVWHNKTTGQVYGMQTNGSSVTNGAMMYTEPDTNWEIVSVGNYNSDTKVELLWWNQQTGQVSLMPMNGLSVSGTITLYTEPDTTWRIQGETEWRDNLYGRGVTTSTIGPINGACGSSNGSILNAAPTANFCATGTASAVSGSDPWSWTCSGSYGGTTATCMAYSYSASPHPVTLLSQNFDSAAPPTLPTGWLSSGSGGGAVWSTNSDTKHPSGAAAHSPGNLVYFNSYTASGGASAMLVSPGFSLANVTGAKVSFWMYRDTGYSTAADLVNVYVHTSPILAGASLLGTLNRSTTLSPIVASAGWYQYSFNIPASYAGTTNYLLINGVGAYGNDIHLDDITVTAINAVSSSAPTASISWQQQ